MSPTPSERNASTRIVMIALLAAVFLLVPAGLVQASGPNGSLRGYITTGSSAPVAGAQVQVTATDVNWVFQATTNAAGYYAISLPNHQYSVDVSAPAYLLNATSVDVGSGQTVWNNMSLNAAPSRSAVLQGYVKNAATSAPVTVGRIAATTVWWSSIAYTNSSSMNATGFYRMTLVPGTYQIATSSIVGYAPYNYGYLYPSGGSTLWFNISLTATPLVAWINGTVLEAGTSVPIASAAVMASVGSLQLPAVQSNATGAYSLHVPTGTISITADAAGHAPYTTNVYVYSAGAYTVNLFPPALSAHERGWVRDGLTGAPIAGARFAASPFWSTGYFDQATTNAAGYFSLNLTADDFDLYASAAGYTSWASYDFLSAGQTSWNNVTLWPIIAPVRGYVIDGGTGAHLANVYVYAYDARSGYATSAVSGSTGLYALLLPPSPAISLRVNGFAPYAGVIAFPDIHAYTTNWVNLTLPRLDAQLDVTVTNGLTGLPISGAYVNAYWAVGSAYGVTDTTGFASVPVPSGLPLSIGAYATGYLSYFGSRDPISGTLAISIVLNPILPTNITVRGYVLDASTRAPITTAVVQASGYNGSTPWAYTNGTGGYTLSIMPRPQTITATAGAHEAGLASVSATSTTTLWVNFTLVPDTAAPRIVNFTATPQNNVGPLNPTTLHASVNETVLSSTAMGLYKLRSSAANLGTFLYVGSIPAHDIFATPKPVGNTSVTSVYATHTPLLTLQDGVSSTWWPQGTTGYPSQAFVSGSFQNASLSAPIPASAVFDTTSGALLYVVAGSTYIEPTVQPTATFTPSTFGYQLNLSTGALVSYVAVSGPSFVVGSLTASLSGSLSSGEYAAGLTVYDTAYNYAQATTFFNVTADTTPPVARAGPNQIVNQGANVTLDGSSSTDNVGITSYTWTFRDGTPQVLHGAIVTHRFLNAGTYVVTLTVTDGSGNAGTATMTVTVRDTTPPTVAITAPSAGATVNGTVTLSATASDNVGVVRVEFRVDGVTLGNATSSPYTLSLNTATLTNGNHTLEAVAYDAAGNSATSSRTIRVANAPVPGSGSPLGFDGMTWLLLLVVIAAVGAFLVILLARRRKRPRAAALPPPPPPPSGGNGPQGP